MRKVPIIGQSRLRFKRTYKINTLLSAIIMTLAMFIMTHSFTVLASDTSYPRFDFGSSHSGMIDESGHVYLWGYNGYGQLGTGNTSQRTRPTRIVIFDESDKEVSFKNLSLGSDFTLLLSQSGDIYVAGRNNYGQLGLGNEVATSYFFQKLVVLDENNRPYQFETIGTGNWNAFAKTTTGKYFVWGYNPQGQLGLGYTGNVFHPIELNVESNDGKLLDLKEIYFGHSHTLFLTTGNELYAVGSNTSGRLGLGHTSTRTVPEKIMVLDKAGNEVKWAKASLGKNAAFSVALSLDGDRYAWGTNSYYELGIELSGTRNAPVLYEVFDSHGRKVKFVDIEAHSYGGSALTSDGKVYAWGRQNNYAGGFNSTSHVRIPTLLNVVDPSGKLEKVTSMTGGEHHFLYKTDSGNIYVTGNGGHGRLGFGNSTTIRIPTLFNPATEYNDPTANDDYVFINDTDHALIDAVANDEAGDGSKLTIRHLLTEPKHGELVFEDGKYRYTPNPNFYGEDKFIYLLEDEFGRADYATVHITVNIVNENLVARYDEYMIEINKTVLLDVAENDTFSLDGGVFLSDISVKPTNGVARIIDGKIEYSPDKDFSGMDSFVYRIEDENGSFSEALVNITINRGIKFSRLASSYTTSAFINDGYELYVFGQNNYYQLGINTYKENIPVPTKVNLFDKTDKEIKWIDVGLGYHHIIALSEDGYIYTAGKNSNGQLGNPNVPVSSSSTTQNFSEELTKITVLNEEGEEIRFSRVYAGLYQSFAISTEGELYAWGRGSHGTLGLGNTTSRSTPTKVYAYGDDGIEVKWRDLSTSGDHTLGLTVENQLFVWGRGNYYRLGLYNTSDQYSPVKMVVLDDSGNEIRWQFAVTGPYSSSSYAITTSGELYVWGYNSDRQLGLGHTTNIREPIKVEIRDESNQLLKFKMVSAGSNFAMFVTTEGDVYAAGSNSSGRLGVGHTSTVREVMKIELLNGLGEPLPVDYIISGREHTIALNDAFNQVYVWGVGTNNRLGLGNDSTYKTVPTLHLALSNQDPVASDDVAHTLEDESVIIDVLENDIDPNISDAISIYDITEQPKNGQITINTDGTLTYIPDGDFNGTDIFRYRITDGRGGFSEAVVTVTIEAVNDDPVANDTSLSTNRNEPLLIDVLAYIIDVDGDILTISNIITNPQNGLLTEQSNGFILYTPNHNFLGEDSFEVEVSDPTGGSDILTITVEVLQNNNAPVTSDILLSVHQGEELTINLFNYIFDAEGDSLTILNLSTPTSGSAVLLSDGVVRYVSDSSFSGNTTFTYQVTDNNGNIVTGNVIISVIAINKAPIAHDDYIELDEDTEAVIDALNNDVDPDGNTLTIIGFINLPTNGSVIIENNRIIYRPQANFHGSDSFTYQISDGEGGFSVATVVLTIHSINDNPIAEDDVESVLKNEEIVIDVLDNDYDIDHDTLILDSIVSHPVNGSIVINQDGTITYTPNTNFVGEDSFIYRVSDGKGGLSEATVTVTVLDQNFPPIANDDFIEVDQYDSIDINVLENDNDPDNDTLKVNRIVQYPKHGIVTIKPDGTITYMPNSTFYGNDSFTYEISDGLESVTATVFITVHFVNLPPVASDDIAETYGDESVEINVLENDFDNEGDNLKVVSATAQNGVVSIGNTGVLTYIPNNGFVGVDTITYEITDGEHTVSANVSVTVHEPLIPPITTNDYSTVVSGETITIDVLDNDVDFSGVGLELIHVSANHGLVSIVNGKVFYESIYPFHGDDVVRYIVRDGNGFEVEGRAYVTVEELILPPKVHDDKVELDQDTDILIDVLNNDENPMNDSLTLSIVMNPTYGTVIVDNNMVRYIPEIGFYGEDSFVYRVTDSYGNSSEAEVKVTVYREIIAPIMDDHHIIIHMNEETSIDLNTLIQNPMGEPLQLTVAQTPNNGFSELNGNLLTYKPNLDFFGSDALTIKISDQFGNQVEAIITFDVNHVNRNPIAEDDFIKTVIDKEIDITPLDNDRDPDGDMIYIEILNHPANGTVIVKSNGVVTYRPNEDYIGNDSFTYRAYDSNGAEDIATVYVEVEDALILVDDVIYVQKDSKDINYLTYISFIDNTRVQQITADDNSVNLSEAGQYPLTFLVEDRDGNTFSYTTTIEVVNDLKAPIIQIVKEVTFELGTTGVDFNDFIHSIIDESDFELFIDSSSVDFNIEGTYAVYYTAIDSYNNKAIAELTVHILSDKTPPVITLVDRIRIETGTPFDNINWLDFIISIRDRSPYKVEFDFGNLNLNITGNYDVTYVVTDDYGNTARKEMVVEVIPDVIGPVINHPEVITIEQSVTPNWLDYITATDNMAIDIQIRINADSIDLEKVGEYELIVEAEDDWDNITIATVKVVVVGDNTPPEIIAPSVIELTTDDAQLDFNRYIQVKDDSSVVVLITDEVNYSTVGVYQVLVTATDEYGNVETKTITVNLKDTSAPVIDLEHPTIEIGTTDFNIMDYLMITDNYNSIEELIVTHNLHIIDFSQLGVYSIDVIVSDASGNIARATLFVTIVEDLTPPKLTTDELEFEVDLETIDSILERLEIKEENDYTIELDEKTVDFNRVGSYQVPITVTDKFNNTTTKIVTIHIRVDLTPPEFNVRTGVKVEVGTEDIFYHDYIFNIYDKSSYTVSINDEILDVNEVGVYELTVIVTDRYENKTEKPLIIEIVDTTKPVFSNLKEIVVSEKEKNVDWLEGVIAHDNYDGDITERIQVDASNVNLDAHGVYKLTLIVTDSNGNTEVAEVEVTVVPRSANYIYIIAGGQSTLLGVLTLTKKISRRRRFSI